MGRADFKLVIESRIRVHTNRRVSRRGGKCRSSRRAYVRPGSQRLVRIAYASIVRRRFGQLATRGSQYDSSALKHALPILAVRGYDRDAKRFLIEPIFEVKHATA